MTHTRKYRKIASCTTHVNRHRCVLTEHKRPLRRRAARRRPAARAGVDSDESTVMDCDIAVYHTVDADADLDGPGSNRGRTHDVYAGVCVINNKRTHARSQSPKDATKQEAVAWKSSPYPDYCPCVCKPWSKERSPQGLGSLEHRSQRPHQLQRPRPRNRHATPRQTSRRSMRAGHGRGRHQTEAASTMSKHALLHRLGQGQAPGPGARRDSTQLAC